MQLQVTCLAALATSICIVNGSWIDISCAQHMDGAAAEGAAGEAADGAQPPACGHAAQ